MFSWLENLINISSCVVVSPIVVSVPKWHKCLVVGDIKVSRDAVGFDAVEKLDVLVDALTVKGDAAPAFHVNVLPLAIVATSTWPKLSKLHRPGSRVTSDANTPSPQSEKFVASVTAVPVLWDALSVPLTFLTILCKFGDDIDA